MEELDAVKQMIWLCIACTELCKLEKGMQNVGFESCDSLFGTLVTSRCLGIKGAKTCVHGLDTFLSIDSLSPHEQRRAPGFCTCGAES